MEISSFPCRDLKNILRRKASRYNGSLPKIFGPLMSSSQSFIGTNRREKSILKSRCRTSNSNGRISSGVYLQEVDFVQLPADIAASMDRIVGSHNLDTIITSEWRATTRNVRTALEARDIQVVDTPEFISQIVSGCLDQYLGSPNSFRTRQHIVATVQNELNALAALEIIGPNPRVTVESIDSDGHIDLQISVQLTNGQNLTLSSRINL